MSDEKLGEPFPRRPRYRAVRIGPMEVYHEMRHICIVTPWWSLVAIPTMAWLHYRAWWMWERVGPSLIVRAFCFVFTCWSPIPYRPRKKVFHG